MSESVKKLFRLFKDGDDSIISKIATGDETQIPFFEFPTSQECKVRVFEDDPMPAMVKRQCSMKKVMYAFLSDVQDWSKLSSWKDRRQSQVTGTLLSVCQKFFKK
ncbi:hypothetical protein X975_03455, partial [Stegodyphus mimosarum]